MQPPLKRLSTGTGQQEGQRMQDVDENFGRVEQAIDTLNAKASLHHPLPQVLSLAFGDTEKETRLFKNAGASADNGTVLADLREDGSATSLILSNGKLILRKTNPDSTSTSVVIAQL